MNKQVSFIEEETNVEKYEFKKPSPIQGYPELYWRGKRPFTSTQYYPAQLKERYGEEKDGWMNKIFWGDNLQVMSHMLKEYRGKIKLVYIDPPFDSKADYKKNIKLKGKQFKNDINSFEEKQYTDIWTNDEYLQFMYERLIIIKQLLTDDGSIYMHCDWHKSHYLRCIMDEVFGAENFKSEIIWERTFNSGSSKALARKFPMNTDTIFYYTKTSNYTFNKQYKPYSEGALKRYDKVDEHGRRFKWNPMKTYSEEKLNRLIEQGEAKIIPTSKYPVYKHYLDASKGTAIDNLWNDIQGIGTFSQEREDYPTQKPETLLQRIINTSSNEGDIVFDCFMGSGTTQNVAMKLGRRFIGTDINLGAIHITSKRVISTIKHLEQTENLYTGFEVYTVNNYDFFRNPEEAKELLLEALEIQKLESNSVYDGEKDGRMFKIMPVNKIATRADLNDFIANLPYKLFDERKNKNPRTPVEKITLVCMGHEADLAAYLKNEANLNLDVNVVDILRDKSKLEFKRDSEAEITINGKKLKIENFYPMNLLQKLSLFNENVEDWRELVESIMIDFNYDGVVMEPSITDVPDKKELVSGEYEIPEYSGRIKVKIIDLLSEIFEWEGDYE